MCHTDIYMDVCMVVVLFVILHLENLKLQIIAIRRLNNMMVKLKEKKKNMLIIVVHTPLFYKRDCVLAVNNYLQAWFKISQRASRRG